MKIPRWMKAVSQRRSLGLTPLRGQEGSAGRRLGADDKRRRQADRRQQSFDRGSRDKGAKGADPLFCPVFPTGRTTAEDSRRGVLEPLRAGQVFRARGPSVSARFASTCRRRRRASTAAEQTPPRAAWSRRQGGRATGSGAGEGLRHV
ncbi:hypothetical protein AAFF_G00044140 [Aldrovandia affinis]|uniref:Uncharacterized protein n=1 Tax=Aldrovandia affinis TaxID=143900 RepID=A0AAD7S4F0_9TELE|nr:hypothetical protein AAFF_G00044140 [Aldrovandia affinis]